MSRINVLSSGLFVHAAAIAHTIIETIVIFFIQVISVMYLILFVWSSEIRVILMVVNFMAIAFGDKTTKSN